MDERLIKVEDIRSAFKEVGIKREECELCMEWTSPKLDEPLTHNDQVLAELTPEEQGFLRCMDYTFEKKVVDTLRLRAMYEIFWSSVRSQHDLPSSNLSLKEGRYVVGM
jgi:hypothetical protein